MDRIQFESIRDELTLSELSMKYNVHPIRYQNRLSGAQSAFATSMLANLKLLFPIKPPEFPMVYMNAFASQHSGKPSMCKRVTSRRLHVDCFSKSRFIIPMLLQRTPVRSTCRMARPPAPSQRLLAIAYQAMYSSHHALCRHEPQHLACRQALTFFDAISFRTALFGISSANNFSSLAFSSSSAFSLRASEASMPPYLALYL